MVALAHQIGQYRLYEPFATGGMATLHLARHSAPGGFGRTVVVKRLHPQYAHDPDFVAMLLDEARLVSRLHHPNVVAVTDVLHEAGELLLVLEYVHGLSLAELACGDVRPTSAVASAIACSMLEGLHAAHEATHESGAPLCIVHRDVSPHNVMVGVDGVARLLDFGVAKATLRAQATRHGELKGKLGYMAPEQLGRAEVDRRADVYAAGVTLWELLAGRRLFPATGEDDRVRLPAAALGSVGDAALDRVLRRALAASPAERFATAREMADAVGDACSQASASEVATWVRDAGGEVLRERSARLAEIERASIQSHSDDTTAPTRPADRPLPPPIPATAGSVSRVAERSPGAVALALVVATLTAGSFWLGVRARAPESASPLAAPASPVAQVAPPTALPSAAQPARTADEAPPAPAAASSASRALPPRPRPARAAASAPAPACSPPWVVDASGIRTFRPECL